MIDMSKPEIKQAYLMGVEAARAELSAELDRVAVVTEKRIVKELDRYRNRLEKENPAAAGHVAVCIGIVKGEVH